MRKYINELSNEELEEVYHANETLQAMVKSDVILNGMVVISDGYKVEDYFIEYYAREKLSPECFIEADKYTLYEQTTYDYDTGKVVSNERDPLEKMKNKEYER